MGKLTINSAKIVGIHGAHKKSINVISNDINAKLNVSSLITFKVNEISNTINNETDSNNTLNNTSETVEFGIRPYSWLKSKNRGGDK